MNVKIPLIATIEGKCRMCYTCVRNCPAKAIRVTDGQAKVILDRCVGCGNCVAVCGRNAKQVYDSLPDVEKILLGSSFKAALVAPSFPADFPDMDYRLLVGSLRALGFDAVLEVAVGADLVANAYRELVKKHPEGHYISSTCPAIVAFVEKYHPALVERLAPIVSPMIATARALRALWNEKWKTVFIGPCLAKKVEASHGHEIDAVLTFAELRALFARAGLSPEKVELSDFDLPRAGSGALFPLHRGLLQSAGIAENLLDSHILAASGVQDFARALREFENGDLDIRLLDILCCDGCIMGPGMSVPRLRYRRRADTAAYVNARLKVPEPAESVTMRKRLEGIDLSARFRADAHFQAKPSSEKINAVLTRLGIKTLGDELNCGACGYPSCKEHAIAICNGLAEQEMCLPRTIERLRESLRDLSVSNQKLENARQALFNAEKLAGMGQLSAGIAHEVNNPLGVILLYANLLLEDCPEGSEQREDLKMIVDQSTRCKKIVSGLLDFARENRVSLRQTDIVELVRSCRKAVIIPESIKVSLIDDIQGRKVMVDPDQIAQVITNLVDNAVEAQPDGGEIVIRVYFAGEREFAISVKDAGTGIAPEHRDKIFEPLYTTKRVGEGTGLGLAVTYGIVKTHNGKIRVITNDDPARGPTGAEFIITLPIDPKKDERSADGAEKTP